MFSQSYRFPNPCLSTATRTLQLAKIQEELDGQNRQQETVEARLLLSVAMPASSALPMELLALLHSALDVKHCTNTVSTSIKANVIPARSSQGNFKHAEKRSIQQETGQRTEPPVPPSSLRICKMGNYRLLCSYQGVSDLPSQRDNVDITP